MRRKFMSLASPFRFRLQAFDFLHDPIRILLLQLPQAWKHLYFYDANTTLLSNFIIRDKAEIFAEIVRVLPDSFYEKF